MKLYPFVLLPVQLLFHYSHSHRHHHIVYGYVPSSVFQKPILQDVRHRRRRIETTTTVPTDLFYKTNHVSQVKKSYDIISSSSTATTSLTAISNRYVEIPLLDLFPTEGDDTEDILVQPLPSIHLPIHAMDIISKLHVYGMKLTIPLHQQIINHAWDIAVTTNTNTNINNYNSIELDENLMPQLQSIPYDDPTKIPLVGVIAYKPTSSTSQQQHPLIGAIGCTVQVLYNSAETIDTEEYKQNFNYNNKNNRDDSTEDNTTKNKKKKKKKKQIINYNTPSTSKTVVCRGLYRFIVRDIKQSIPYTVALVEELHDDDNNTDNNVKSEQQNNTINNNNDIYSNMTTTELMQRTIQSIQYNINQMIQDANIVSNQQQSLTLLEESILKDNGLYQQQQLIQQMTRETIEEYISIWNTYQSIYIDDMTVKERYYSIPFIAAELCHLNNTIRQQMLQITNPMERLKLVCQATAIPRIDTFESGSSTTSSTTNATAAKASVRTQKMNTIISDTINFGSSSSNSNSGTIISPKDLKVGIPKLPKWSKQIKKGTILEYYWNEEYGWCRCQVIDEPLYISGCDEIVLTVYFSDDQTTHRLPLSLNDVARWRPPSSSTPPPPTK